MAPRFAARLLVLGLAALSPASPSASPGAAAVAEIGQLRVPGEPALDSLPGAWHALAPTPRGRLIELTFAVRQQGLDELHDTLLRVSSPASPDYGRHLSLEEVNRLTAPRPEHVEVVASFIRSHGLHPAPATPNSDMIVATAPVEVAERMLGARYVDLEHRASKAVIPRTPGGYFLPAEVAAAVDFVSPTTHIPGVRRPTKLEGVDPNAIGFNTPKNLRQLYEVDVEGKAEGNKQAVTAFLEQGYSSKDLHRFWNRFCSGISCGKGEPKLVGDAVGPPAGTESMLDIETITGIAGSIHSEFWGFSGRSPDNPANEPFMKWLEKLSSTSDDDAPKVFSTSYGEDEGSWSFPASQRLNAEFMKAGARGISLLFASGDEGANCKAGKFVAEGPGSSPYVTAVGGTKPDADWPRPGGERAVGLSSGGFSSYWAMPDWQKDAVRGYLAKSGLPDAEERGVNVSGRAYPDIAAQATNFFVDSDIPEPGVAGTSCAAPTAAGVIALLNDLRMQHNQSSLGFLNPLIYAHPEAFTDITDGAGGGCGFSSGWPARPGWDAVTGVGTPSYARLARVVTSLPSGRGVMVVV